jgi:CDP-diglyceride synthetase
MAAVAAAVVQMIALVAAAEGTAAAADGDDKPKLLDRLANLAVVVATRGEEEFATLARVYACFLLTMPLVLTSSDQTFKNRMRVAYGLIFVLTPCALKFVAYTRVVGALISLGALYELCLMYRSRAARDADTASPSIYLISIGLWVHVPMLMFLFGPDQWVLDAQDITTMILMSDAYQYIGGKIFKLDDRRPFPTLSPKKSLGGYTFAVGSVSLVYAMFTKFNILQSVGIIIFGIFGDLVASWIKRDAGEKDFGAMLGAHGGIIDRFDGCFTAITVYTVLTWGGR